MVSDLHGVAGSCYRCLRSCWRVLVAAETARCARNSALRLTKLSRAAPGWRGGSCCWSPRRGRGSARRSTAPAGRRTTTRRSTASTSPTTPPPSHRHGATRRRPTAAST
eukprot:scaffold57947_cov47-Phaeocystis_antarctica.AAC.1